MHLCSQARRRVSLLRCPPASLPLVGPQLPPSQKNHCQMESWVLALNTTQALHVAPVTVIYASWFNSVHITITYPGFTSCSHPVADLTHFQRRVYWVSTLTINSEVVLMLSTLCLCLHIVFMKLLAPRSNLFLPPDLTTRRRMRT